MSANQPDTCTFSIAWRGPCGSPADDDRCALHKPVVCHCGSLAVSECPQTMGPSFCGAPLCADHKHGEPMNLCPRLGDYILKDGVRLLREVCRVCDAFVYWLPGPR